MAEQSRRELKYQFHPGSLLHGKFYPDCEHCLASLISEQTTGEELNVNNAAWAFVSSVAALLGPPTANGLDQKKIDRKVIKDWARQQSTLD